MKQIKEVAKIHNTTIIIFSAFTGVLVGIILLVYMADKNLESSAESWEEIEIQQQAEKDKRIELVAAELDINKKNVLEDGETWEGYKKYKTDQGEYIVEFEEEEIKRIVKDIEE